MVIMFLNESFANDPFQLPLIKQSDCLHSQFALSSSSVKWVNALHRNDVPGVACKFCNLFVISFTTEQ